MENLPQHNTFNFESDKPEIELKHAELIDDVCDLLYPTTGFRLTLEGIKPAMADKKAIEAFAQIGLSDEYGATIELAYNITTDSLELQSIQHPLASNPDGYFSILRTDSPHEDLRYIPIIDTGQSDEDLVKNYINPTLTGSTLESILAGYGVAEIPHPSHESYQLWRADFLSACQDGWKTTEQVTLLTGLTDTATETISVKNELLYQEGGEVLRTKEVGLSNLLAEPNSMTTQETATRLTQEEGKIGIDISLQEEVITKEIDTIVVNNDTVVEIKRETLPVTSTSLRKFKDICTEAKLYLQLQRP